MNCWSGEASNSSRSNVGAEGADRPVPALRRRRRMRSPRNAKPARAMSSISVPPARSRISRSGRVIGATVAKTSSSGAAWPVAGATPELVRTSTTPRLLPPIAVLGSQRVADDPARERGRHERVGDDTRDDRGTGAPEDARSSLNLGLSAGGQGGDHRCAAREQRADPMIRRSSRARCGSVMSIGCLGAGRPDGTSEPVRVGYRIRRISHTRHNGGAMQNARSD